jgi:hypothetical protein
LRPSRASKLSGDAAERGRRSEGRQERLLTFWAQCAVFTSSRGQGRPDRAFRISTLPDREKYRSEQFAWAAAAHAAVESPSSESSHDGERPRTAQRWKKLYKTYLNHVLNRPLLD